MKRILRAIRRWWHGDNRGQHARRRFEARGWFDPLPAAPPYKPELRREHFLPDDVYWWARAVDFGAWLARETALWNETRRECGLPPRDLPPPPPLLAVTG